ncbi:MAG: DUF4446 family protein [Lachnospiraceae bacterium]|nr:DUF4446 family protein [Lachnospiraceae bacterium]
MDQSALQTAVMAASIIISIVAIVIAVIAILKYKNIYRLYDSFIRGRDAESLEDLILEEEDRIEALEAADAANKEVMRTMNRNIRASFQKCGVVRYDAFEGMGGKVSFALALLDYTNTGIILNCMHSASGCFLYIKEVEAGATDVQLGAEEKGALERALGYVSD